MNNFLVLYQLDTIFSVKPKLQLFLCLSPCILTKNWCYFWWFSLWLNNSFHFVTMAQITYMHVMTKFYDTWLHSRSQLIPVNLWFEVSIFSTLCLTWQTSEKKQLKRLFVNDRLDDIKCTAFKPSVTDLKSINFALWRNICSIRPVGLMLAFRYK